MKKNIVVLAGALALVAAVGLGSTFAYFTDKEEVSNVVTFGHVDVVLTESDGTKDEAGEEVYVAGGLKFENLVPGDTVTKKAKVELGEDSKDAFVRATITMAWAEGVEVKEADLKDVELKLGEGWVKGEDGKYYYNKKLDADNSSSLIFTEVKLPTSWTNEVADKSFTIDVKVDAVQADNFDFDWAALGEVADYEN